MAQDNLTIEELLEIAESSSDPTVNPKNERAMKKYLNFFGITSGPDKIPAHIIYYHYRKWRKQNYMTSDTFFKVLKGIFERDKNVAAYYIDGPFDTSLEGSLKARSYLRKDRNVKRKQKEKRG